MKQKLAGIILLVVVILAAGGYVTFLEKNQVTVLNGYIFFPPARQPCHFMKMRRESL